MFVYMFVFVFVRGVMMNFTVTLLSPYAVSPVTSPSTPSLLCMRTRRLRSTPSTKIAINTAKAIHATISAPLANGDSPEVLPVEITLELPIEVTLNMLDETDAESAVVATVPPLDATEVSTGMEEDSAAGLEAAIAASTAGLVGAVFGGAAPAALVLATSGTPFGI